MGRWPRARRVAYPLLFPTPPCNRTPETLSAAGGGPVTQPRQDGSRGRWLPWKAFKATRLGVSGPFPAGRAISRSSCLQKRSMGWRTSGQKNRRVPVTAGSLLGSLAGRTSPDHLSSAYLLWEKMNHFFFLRGPDKRVPNCYVGH